MTQDDWQSAYEATAAMNENMKIENERLIHKNKELKIRLAFLEEENKYYITRRKSLSLVNMGG